jgi:hypothetical protein
MPIPFVPPNLPQIQHVSLNNTQSNISAISANQGNFAMQLSKTNAKKGVTYYTVEFGYEKLPTTMDGLKFLLASEAISFYDHPPDLANFYNAIYEQFGEPVLKQIADAHLLPRSVSERRYRESIYGKPDRTFYNSSGRLTHFTPGSPNAEGQQPAMEVVRYPSF